LFDTGSHIPNENSRTTCNPFKDRVQDHDEAWNWLGRHAIEYNWQYRKKICLKCSLETQNILNCMRFDNYQVIDGVKIQETHCSKLENARAKKLRNHVKHVLALNPLTKS
jgi:hypothetical protein